MKLAISPKTVVLAIFLSFAAFAPAGAENEISDAKLQAFVTAAVSVNKIIEQWTPRIKNAESQEAANELMAQANAELVAAIEESGEITVQEYKDISQAARADPALSARIEEIVQQRFGQ